MESDPDPEITDDNEEPATHGPGDGGNKTPIRIGAVVAVALVAAFAAWLLIQRDDGAESATGTTTTAPNVLDAPKAISAAALEQLAAGGTTVYWAGPKPAGYTYTLAKSSNGSVYVRYLPPGVTASDPIPPSLVVATYPLEDALSAVKRAAKAPDTVSIPLDEGGMAVYAKSRPTNVYFAYPDSSVQVEVYDPSDGRALQLVTSGAITQISK